jgi:hypothetical protein
MSYTTGVRAFLAALVLALASSSFAQALWFDVGVGYRPGVTQPFDPLVKLGLRGTLPVSEYADVFLALGARGGLVIDAGAWFSLEPGLRDPVGWQAHLGVGASYTAGGLGAVGSAALSYELTRNLALFALYSHRLLLLPRASQGFEVSAGVRFALD